jgi:hypothetical protein
MPGFTNGGEAKILDGLTGKAAAWSPAPLSLALCTVAVTETDTALTITKANYTGYADKVVAAADWNATGVDGVVETAVQEAFANCTGGTSTVIAWALISGNDVVMYGTCPSVQISTTQTPPTVAAGGVSMTLD